MNKSLLLICSIIFLLLISCFVAGCADSDKSETSSPSFFTDDPANSFKLEADIQNNIDIMIIWEPIEDADEYILSRAVSGTGNYIDIAKFSADSEPKYIDSFIDTGICYTYKLQTADGTASESIEVDVPLYNEFFTLTEHYTAIRTDVFCATHISVRFILIPKANIPQVFLNWTTYSVN